MAVVRCAFDLDAQRGLGLACCPGDCGVTVHSKFSLALQ